MERQEEEEQGEQEEEGMPINGTREKKLLLQTENNIGFLGEKEQGIGAEQSNRDNLKTEE